MDGGAGDIGDIALALEEGPDDASLVRALRAAAGPRATGAGGDRHPGVIVANTARPAAVGPWLLRGRPLILVTGATPRNARHPDAPGAGPLSDAAHRWHRYVCGRVRAHLPWSQWAARSLVYDYGVDPRRITVIRPGLDLAAWRPGAGRPAASGPVRLLVAGDAFVRAGAATLSECLAATGLTDRCEVHLAAGVALSSGPGAGSAVWHTERDPAGSTRRRLYDLADVLVVPTQAGCFPAPVVEALACGVPVIAPAVECFPELVEHGATGLLVPAGDPRALGEALRALVDDPQGRAAMGRRARRAAEEHHDVRKGAASLLAVTGAVLANVRAGRGADPVEVYCP